METLTNTFAKYMRILGLNNGELLEIFVILVVFGVAYFLNKLICVNLSKRFRKNFEAKSQSIFDIKYYTFVYLCTASFLMFCIYLGFEYFLGKTYFLIQAATIILAWLGIRGFTYVIDTSLLSRFVANVIWLTAALFITGYFDEFSELLKSFSYKVGKVELSSHTFVVGIVIFSVLFWIATIIAHLVKKFINHNHKLNITQRVLIMKIVRIFLYSLVFIIGIQVVGIDMTTITVFGGAIGFGIGFGLQKVFSNLISGIILLLDKSIRPGDVVGVAGTYGEVKKLEARYVSVVTRDGKKHLIPNEHLISERVENWSYMDHQIRLHIPVGVAYGSDLRLVQKLMLEAVDETPDRILKYPEPVCLLMGFGDSSIDFELRLWISDPHNGCEKPQSDVLFRVWDKFKEHNIEIPFPQRDVHIVDQPKSIFG